MALMLLLRPTKAAAAVVIALGLGAGCDGQIADDRVADGGDDSGDTSAIDGAVTADAWPPEDPGVIEPLIAIGNAEAKTLEVYAWEETSWTPGVAEWIWTPTTALGFSSTGIDAFDGPYEHKVRNVDGFPGKASKAVCVVGHRWLGVIAYEGAYERGRKLWGTFWSAAQNPSVHGCELLPNGNLAVASPGAGGYGAWVRIYDTSDITVGTDFVSVPLPSARNLTWDPDEELLWTAGRDPADEKYYVMAFTIGTRTEPQLVEQLDRRRPAPGPYPHDLAPYYGDKTKLWFADHSGLYIFDKTQTDPSLAFTPAPGDSNRATLKSAGNQNGGGLLIETLRDPACGAYCTKHVDFYDPATGVKQFERTANHARIYRARVFTTDYN